jgi:hypothetical protein
MNLYQIRAGRMVAFAIEKVERSQQLTNEQFIGSLVIVLMHHKNWCTKIIFKKHAFTLVTNTQQKT